MGGGGKHFNDSSAQPANRAFPTTLDTHGGRGGIKGERGKKRGRGKNWGEGENILCYFTPNRKKSGSGSGKHFFAFWFIASRGRYVVNRCLGLSI